MRNEYLMIDFAGCEYKALLLTDKQVADAQAPIIRFNEGQFEECIASTSTIKGGETTVKLLWVPIKTKGAELSRLIEEFKLESAAFGSPTTEH